MQSFNILILLALLHLYGALAQVNVVKIGTLCSTKWGNKNVQTISTTSTTQNLYTVRVTGTTTTTVLAGTTTACQPTSTVTFTPSSATTLVSSSVKTEATTLVSTVTTTVITSTTATETTTLLTSTTVTVGPPLMLRGRAVFPTAVVCTEYDVLFSTVSTKTVTAKKIVTVTPSSTTTRTITGKPTVVTFVTVVTSTTTSISYSTTIATTLTTAVTTTTDSSISTVVVETTPPLQTVYNFLATAVDGGSLVDLTVTIDRSMTCSGAFGDLDTGSKIGFKVISATGTYGISPISYDPEVKFDFASNCIFPDNEYHLDYNGFSFSTPEDENNNFFFDPGHDPVAYYIEGTPKRGREYTVVFV